MNDLILLMRNLENNNISFNETEEILGYFGIDLTDYSILEVKNAFQTAKKFNSKFTELLDEYYEFMKSALEADLIKKESFISKIRCSEKINIRLYQKINLFCVEPDPVLCTLTVEDDFEKENDPVIGTELSGVYSEIYDVRYEILKIVLNSFTEKFTITLHTLEIMRERLLERNLMNW